jgi:hypothetical protein
MIRFFVGTDVNGGCAECQMVYEYSLQKNCSEPYEIVWMKISTDPTSFWSGWNTSTWSTPFSGFRYGIAEYCNYEGKAIYTDDDQMWLQDPAKLFSMASWMLDSEKDKVMTGKQLANDEVRHCVSVIDNAKFKQFPPASRRKRNENFCNQFKSLTFPRTLIIGDTWNCYDGEDLPIDQIGLLHFTDMTSNPGVHMAIERLGSQANHWYDGPLREHRRKDCVDLFHQYYNEALAAGYSLEKYLPETPIQYEKLSQEGYQANNGWG